MPCLSRPHLPTAVWCLGLALLGCGDPQSSGSAVPNTYASAPSASGGGPVAGAPHGPSSAGAADGGNAGAAHAASGAGSASGAGGAGGASTAGTASGAGGAGGASTAGTASGAGASSGGAGGAGGAFSSCAGVDGISTVYAIGDSTMSAYDDNDYPRMGWAQPLGELFAPACARVVDKALSGRSSKSFFDEGAWQPVKSSLVSGDYVLIQFGHNDEKSEDPARYTEPQTSYKQYLTTYVNDTRARQANPILLTSINRNSWSNNTLKDTHGAYPEAVRELASTLNVPLIDLEALTRSYFERIGPTNTSKLFLILAPGQFPNYPNGVTDNTHLQQTGARTIGRLAMADAYARQLPLAGLLKAEPVAP